MNESAKRHFWFFLPSAVRWEREGKKRPSLIQVYKTPLPCRLLFIFFPRTAVRGARAKIGPATYKCKRVLAKRSKNQVYNTPLSCIGLFLIFFPHTTVRGVRAKIGPATSVNTPFDLGYSNLPCSITLIVSEVRGYMALTSVASEAVGGHSTLGI